MLLSINKNKLFCEKSWIFPAFSVSGGYKLLCSLLGGGCVCFGGLGPLRAPVDVSVYIL